MPENPNPPEPPASGQLPPEQPAEQTRTDETVTLPKEPAAAEPREPGRFRRAASHRATPIVAAALAGLLVGGGVMALIAYTGDDDRDDRPGRVEMFRDGPRGFDGFERFDQRGGPWRKLPPPMRQDLRDRLQERLERLPVPDHRHDEDGNIIPAPREDSEQNGGN